MGVLIINGIQPGPSMVTEHMSLLFTVIWSFALANIIGAGLCLFLCKPLARLTTIRFAYLAPAFLITMIFGAYQSTQHLGDLAVMLGLGLLGWGMKRMGWPRPPFLIAFVLSVSTERYLWISANRFGWAWLTRPGVLAILAVLVAALVYWFITRRREARGAAKADPSPASSAHWRFTPKAGFTLGMFLLMTAAVLEASSYPFFAGLLPLVAAVPGALLAGWQFVADLRHPEEKKSVMDLGTSEEAASRAGTRRAFLYFAVILGYFGLIALVGFRPATLIFLVGFLRGLSGATWLRTGLYTATVFAILALLQYTLSVEMPESLWSLGF
jgi:hypothetical protein